MINCTIEINVNISKYLSIFRSIFNEKSVSFGAEKLKKC
jgi:hypothetical protein